MQGYHRTPKPARRAGDNKPGILLTREAPQIPCQCSSNIYCTQEEQDTCNCACSLHSGHRTFLYIPSQTIPSPEVRTLPHRSRPWPVKSDVWRNGAWPGLLYLGLAGRCPERFLIWQIPRGNTRNTQNRATCNIQPATAWGGGGYAAHLQVHYFAWISISGNGVYKCPRF